MSMMRELGHQIGRFKVRRLMKEEGLTSKQPGSHAYKAAWAQRPDVPNLLAREFAVSQPNQVCCFTPTRAANMAAGHFGIDCGTVAWPKA